MGVIHAGSCRSPGACLRSTEASGSGGRWGASDVTQEGRRHAAHLIDPSDVDEWLRDSAVKRTTFHWTSAADARQIVAEGVRSARTDPEATWGRGFYASTRYLRGFGDTSVHVAVRLLRPLVVEDRIAPREWLDELRVALGTDDVRSTLLAAGSDGVVILWESGEM